jgi:hypothetical protein
MVLCSGAKNIRDTKVTKVWIIFGNLREIGPFGLDRVNKAHTIHFLLEKTHEVLILSMGQIKTRFSSGLLMVVITI